MKRLIFLRTMIGGLIASALPIFGQTQHRPKNTLNPPTLSDAELAQFLGRGTNLDQDALLKFLFKKLALSEGKPILQTNPGFTDSSDSFEALSVELGGRESARYTHCLRQPGTSTMLLYVSEKPLENLSGSHYSLGQDATLVVDDGKCVTKDDLPLSIKHLVRSFLDAQIRCATC